MEPILLDTLQVVHGDKETVTSPPSPHVLRCWGWSSVAEGLRPDTGVGAQFKTGLQHTIAVAR